MTGPTVGIAIDVFHPDSYRPAAWNGPGTPPPNLAEDSGFDGGHLYVVLQPMVLARLGDGDLPSGPSGALNPIRLADWFKPALRLAPADAVAQGGTALAQHYGAIEAAEKSLARRVPVPLPRETRLALRILDGDPTQAGSAVLWEWERTAGRIDPGTTETSPFLLKDTDWPAVANAGFIEPVAWRWGLLTGAQRTGATVWLRAAIVDLLSRQAKAAALPPDQLKPGETPSDAQTLALRHYGLPDMLPVTAELGKPTFDSHLAEMLPVDPSQTRGAAIYDALLHDPAPAAQRLYPPRFRVQHVPGDGPDNPLLKALREQFTRMQAPAGARVSYAAALWQSFCDALPGGADADPGPVIKALGRYFGFGERLRWPRPADVPPDGVPDTRDFMVCRRNVPGNADLIETNAFSLAELVFRVPIAAFGGIGRDRLHVRVEVAGAPLAGPGETSDTALAKRLGEKVHDVATAAAAWTAACRTTLARSPDRTEAKGLIFYQARAASAEPLERVPADLPGPVYAVPAALLDVVDATPRTLIGIDGEGLTAGGTPRRALFHDELWQANLALAGTKPSWRILARLIHVPLSGVKPPATQGAPAGGAYRLVSEALADPEDAAWRLLQEDAFPAVDAHLWLPQADGSVSALALSDLGIRAGGGGELLLTDAGGVLGGALSPPAPGSGAPWDVQLVISAAGTGRRPFNLLTRYGAPPPDTPRPFLALGTGTVTRVGRSNDRWLERITARAAAEPTPLPDDPIAAHLDNFNKLRLLLHRTDTGGTDSVTFPDAALPLDAPLRPRVPGGPYEYFIAHLFAQQTTADRSASAAAGQPVADEDVRYRRYRDPNGRVAVLGYLEHQYAIRIPVVDADPNAAFTLDSRLATDLRNVGDLHARLRKSEELFTLLKADVNKETGAIALTIDGAYIAAALTPTSDDPAEADSGKVDVHRTIYEAVHDTCAALRAGDPDAGVEGAALTAELWTYDNTRPAHPGAMGRSLRRTLTGRLPLDGGDGPGKMLLTVLAPFSPPTYEAFKAALAAPGPAVTVPVDPRAGWTWTRPGGGRADPPDLAAESTVMRVGLEVTRADDRIVDPAMADGAYRMLKRDGMSPGIPDWFGREDGTLAATARTETKAYFAPDSLPLRRRHVWLAAVPPSAVPDGGRTAGTPREPDAKRYRSLFGEIAERLVVPSGRQQPIGRVARLLYVPFAPRPLAPHPTLGNRPETEGFAAFLVSVADALLSGRAPESLNLEPVDVATADAALTDLRDALDQRIGDALGALMWPVHREDGASSIADPTLRALYERTVGHLRAARPGIDARMRALFAAAPGQWTRTRAVGVGLFDPDTLPRALHGVQIVKAIRKAARRDAAQDTDRFVVATDAPPSGNGPRFLLDPLEAKRYDAEFEIRMNRYEHGGAEVDPVQTPSVLLDPVDLDRGWNLRARGGCTGRTGEAAIEDLDPFLADEAEGTGAPDRRGVEVNAIAWNAHWRRVPRHAPGAARHYYLLPSRNVPQAPVLANVTDADGRPVDASTLVYAPPAPGTPATLDEAFAQAVRRSLARVDGPLVSPRAAADHAPDGSSGAPAWTEWVLEPQDAGHPSRWRSLCPAATAAGWYRIDTRLEHHYFIVEAGEDDRVSPFANDVIEIDVDLTALGNRIDMPAPAPEPPADAERLAGSTLYAWYSYDRQRRTGQAPEPPTTKPTVSDVVAALDLWLSIRPKPPQADEPPVLAGERKACNGVPLLHPLGLQDDTDVPPPKGCRIRYSPGEALLDVPAQATAGATVVAADLFHDAAQPEKGQPEESRAEKTGRRHLLRISVLAEPWTRPTVRVRIRRNERDMDGGGADIDPAFASRSAFSPWHGGTVAPWVIGDASAETSWESWAIPEAERRLAIRTLSLRRFLETRFAAQAPDTGTPLADRIRARFADPSGNGNTLPYWNEEAMLGRQMVAVLRQRFRDHHVLASSAGLTRPAERDGWWPRYEFSPGSGGDLDGKLREAAADALHAGDMHLDVTWLDPRTGHPVLRILWPLGFGETG